MFAAFKLDAIDRLSLAPPEVPASTGVLLLMDGSEFTGSWVWYADVGFVYFVSTDGTIWILDAESVIAISPLMPLPPPPPEDPVTGNP